MRKIYAIVLVILIIFTVDIAANADSVTDKAEVLYNLGLLKGTDSSFSVEGLELSRSAKRIEICVTVVRMLGKEEKALYQENSHPFSDVPDWANPYVGWLYENYLVNGVNDNYFGTDSTATTKQFCAMILRVLGYSEAEGHFEYNDAVKLALEKRIITQKMAYKDILSRENMVIICYNALNTTIRNSKKTLITKLCDDAAVDREKAEMYGVLKKANLTDAFPNVPETLGGITVYRAGSYLTLVFDKPVEEYGIRLYMMGSNGILREVKEEGYPFFKKGEKKYVSGGAAGYIEELYIYNLPYGQRTSFIVVKTSSEGEIFNLLGKSKMAEFK